MQCDKIQWRAIQHDAVCDGEYMALHEMQCNAMQCNAIQCDVVCMGSICLYMQCNARLNNYTMLCNTMHSVMYAEVYHFQMQSYAYNAKCFAHIFNCDIQDLFYVDLHRIKMSLKELRCLKKSKNVFERS